jgi:Fe-coproporphyrin III synthase
MIHSENSGALRAGLILSKGIRLLKKPSPDEVIWLNYAITYACNCRCRMCNIWKKYRDEPALPSRELTLQDIDKFLGSKSLRNLQGIGLTGGEPFLREDIVDLAGLFIKRYPAAFISITTNGLASETIVQRTRDILKRYKPGRLHVSISLDGTRQTHDIMRGVQGAYARVMQTAGLLQNQTEVSLGFDFTITRHNYLELPRVSEIAQKKGVKLSAGFAHISQSYYGNQDMSFSWKNKELNEITHFMEAAARNRTAPQSLLLKTFDPYAYIMSRAVEYESTKQRMFRCLSGTLSFFLDPQGDVYPCLINNEKLGNIQDNRFEDFWLSSRANKARLRIDQKNCHCWVDCEVAPSLIRSLRIVGWNITHNLLPGFHPQNHSNGSPDF